MSTSARTRCARRPRVETLEHRTLLAAALPLGSEFRVNTVTANSQLATRVAAQSDGSFVVVYASTGQAGPAGTVGQDVYARRYDASGAPLGNEFLVNTTIVNHQELPSIAMDDAGDFVVVWQSTAQDSGSTRGVYGQRFNSAGAQVGGEFLVNVTTAGHQQFPTVAMDGDGDFVVAWENYDLAGEYNVLARRYDAAGVPQSSEFIVSSTTAGLQAATSIAMDSAGDFVVAWGANQVDSVGYDIYARRFSAAGAAQGGEFRVNTTTANTQYFPWVAEDDDGDFVVAWQSDLQGTNKYDVYAQRYNAAGVAQGGEIHVNTTVTDDQDFAYVSMDGAGNFIVVWESLEQDGGGYGSYGQAFFADGMRAGTEFRANFATAEDQSFPSVALANNDRAVVVWQSRLQDGSSFGVYGQRYNLDLVAPSVTGSTFHFATKPHKVRFTFSEDVSASLTASDLTVVNLAGGPPLNVQLDGYDSGTNTATFSFPSAPNGGVLPDGRYNATISAAGVTDAAGNQLAAQNLSFDFFFMLADANHDAKVNVNDFSILASNFGFTGRDYTQGDFNYDGQVNVNDFAILASRFGTSLPAATGRGSTATGALTAGAGASPFSARKLTDSVASRVDLLA